MPTVPAVCNDDVVQQSRTDAAKIDYVQITCGDVKRIVKSLKKDKSPGPDGIPPILLNEQLPAYKIFSGFTGIWTIAKRLANSKRISNIQRGLACRSERLPAGEPNQNVLLSYGAHYQICTCPICRFTATYE